LPLENEIVPFVPEIVLELLCTQAIPFDGGRLPAAYTDSEANRIRQRPATTAKTFILGSADMRLERMTLPEIQSDERTNTPVEP